jgi:magnesium transporter
MYSSQDIDPSKGDFVSCGCGRFELSMSKTVRTFSHFTWTDVYKPTQEELVDLTASYTIDITLFEDILEYGHLPKIEKLHDFTFIILRAHLPSAKENAATVMQLTNKIAFFVNDRDLITVHRADFDFISNRGEGYDSSEELMLDIINEVLMSYEQPLELQNDKMDDFEREIFLRGGQKISIESLYYQRSKARICRKVLQLTQTVLNQVNVKPTLNTLLQDSKETTLNFVLQYDELIEDANTILHSYMSVTAQKNNDVMRLLTIFSAFFLPLTFIVGIYGMNFDHMPELRWPNGYFYSLGFMAGVCVVIWMWFKRKKIM